MYSTTTEPICVRTFACACMCVRMCYGIYIQKAYVVFIVHENNMCLCVCVHVCVCGLCVYACCTSLAFTFVL